MITVVTAWYILKSKFDKTVYKSWMSNFLLNVNKFNLVVFTDKKSYHMIEDVLKNIKNDKIKIIFYELDEFYNYKYKDEWIKNQKNNHLLKMIDWELNMLWSEKISFVRKAVAEKYFESDFYIWCDIGYFRCRHRDMSFTELKNWGNNEKVEKLDKNKIHYALVNPNISHIISIIKNQNTIGLPIIPIPPNQVSVAGGFFVIDKDEIEWWFKTYDEMLNLYFKNNYLVKDDQMIIINCIFKNRDRFELHQESDNRYDNWFMFQRILC